MHLAAALLRYSNCLCKIFIQALQKVLHADYLCALANLQDLVPKMSDGVNRSNLQIRTFVLQASDDSKAVPRSLSPPQSKKAKVEPTPETTMVPICTSLNACIVKWGLKPPFVRPDDDDYWANYYFERAVLEHRHPALKSSQG